MHLPTHSLPGLALQCVFLVPGFELLTFYRISASLELSSCRTSSHHVVRGCSRSEAVKTRPSDCWPGSLCLSASASLLRKDGRSQQPAVRVNANATVMPITRPKGREGACPHSGRHWGQTRTAPFAKEELKAGRRGHREDFRHVVLFTFCLFWGERLADVKSLGWERQKLHQTKKELVSHGLWSPDDPAAERDPWEPGAWPMATSPSSRWDAPCSIRPRSPPPMSPPPPGPSHHQDYLVKDALKDKRKQNFALNKSACRFRLEPAEMRMKESAVGTWPGAARGGGRGAPSLFMTGDTGPLPFFLSLGITRDSDSLH